MHKNAVSDKIFIFLSIVLLSILGLIIFKPISVIIKYIVNATSVGLFSPMLWLYIFICIVYTLCYTHIKNTNSNFKICINIFVLAVIPRAIVCLFNQYIPTNDFLEYLKFGQNMFYGRKADVANIIQNKYFYSKMGGLALFNDGIAHVFSPQLIGFQIANIIMTSFICVMLFVLVKKYSKNVGLIAAFLYTLYPANIISTQITTNRHGATLMLLISILLYIKALDALKLKRICKGLILAFLTSICLVISNFIHMSIIIVTLSIVFSSLILMVDDFIKNDKKVTESIKRIAIYIVVIVIFNSLLTGLVVNFCYNKGVITSKEELTPLAAIAVGLNRETGGVVRKDDWGLITTTPSDKVNEVCLKLIKERLDNPKEVIKLMINKLKYVWAYNDSEFTWYSEGMLNSYKEKIEKDPNNTDLIERQNKLELLMGAVSNIDTVFVQVLYLFAILGILYLIKNIHFVDKDVILILMFFILGWMATIAIGAAQPRYRYQSMVGIILFSSFGIDLFYTKVISFINKTKKRYAELKFLKQ